MPAKKPGIRPLGDRVIIKRMEEVEQTRGGIIVPDTAKEKPQRGKVIGVGPGRVADDGKRIAPEVKKGNMVLFGKYSGTDVSMDDDEYLIVREDDILAIIE
jgi:chaperonin GroES